MHFEQLNDDILFMVLDVIAKDVSEKLFQWKTILPLLHVNQRWRNIASPIVYKTVLIERSTTDEHGQLNVVSNMPVVCTEHAHKHIRELTISTFLETNVVMFYKKVLEMLAQHKDMLYTIVSICQDGEEWVKDNNDTDEITEIIARLGIMFFQAMPSVKNLLLDELEPGAISEQIHGTLIGSYAHQLDSLKIVDIIALPQLWNPNNLTSLDIGLSNCEHSYNMLCISVSSLVYLNLRSVSLNFIWNCFKFRDNGNSSQAIKFSCLKQLYLSFESDTYNGSEMSKPKYQLQFPRLEELHVVQLPAKSKLFERCVFPKAVKSVILAMPFRSLGAMLKRNDKLPTMDKFVLRTLFRTPAEEGYYTEAYKSGLTNKFIERYHGTKETVLLTTFGYEFNLLYQAANIARLSTIILAKCKSIIAVKETLENAPHLVSFSAFLTPTNGFQHGDMNSLSSDLTPINTNVKELNLFMLGPINEIIEEYSAVMEYLLLRIITLKRIRVYKLATRKVGAIIQKYKNEYPHLQHVSLSD